MNVGAQDVLRVGAFCLGGHNCTCAFSGGHTDNGSVFIISSHYREEPRLIGPSSAPRPKLITVPWALRSAPSPLLPRDQNWETWMNVLCERLPLVNMQKSESGEGARSGSIIVLFLSPVVFGSCQTS